MSNESNIKVIPLKELPLWDKLGKNKKIFSFVLEITPRCNLNCRHCYINLPAGDKKSTKSELTLSEIDRIVDEAISMGALWCLISGGEPLLRKDFLDIYVSCKKKGLLLSVFTNATLINQEHIKIFKKYPPRDIEVTVYGASAETFDSVTRRSGSYDNFLNGLALLHENKVPIRLKAMALRSNVHEFKEISRFCRKFTKDYFRYDPNLNLRFDRDEKRNKEIMAERLSPEQVLNLEMNDNERSRKLLENCNKYINSELKNRANHKVFNCGVGNGSFVIGYDGKLRLCSSLVHPEFTYDLRKGTIKKALELLIPKLQNLSTKSEKFINMCGSCSLVNLCQWCPAEAYLEEGQLDAPVDHFCQAAKMRAGLLKKLATENSTLI